MAGRTVQTIISNVQRKLNGLASVGEIYQAVQNSHNQIYASYNWPWTLAQTNLQIAPIYNTGTVSITDGTSAVTGAGTTWNVNWTYKTLYLGSNTVYPITSFGGVGACTLAQTINTGQNWVAATYTIYQEYYPLPADCDPGGIICIVNPKIRYRLRKIPRFTMENRALTTGMFFNNYQDSWSDGGYDEVGKTYLLKIMPPPSAATEYMVIYHRKAPDITALASVSEIPPTFDQALELLAESEVKRNHNQPGWQEAKQEGYQLIQKLRRYLSTQIMDVYKPYIDWPTLGENTMLDTKTGLIIGGPTVGGL